MQTARHDVLEARHDDGPRLPLLATPHRALPIRDLQGVFYQRQAVRDRSHEAVNGRRVAGPATIPAAC